MIKHCWQTWLKSEATSGRNLGILQGRCRDRFHDIIVFYITYSECDHVILYINYLNTSFGPKCLSEPIKICSNRFAADGAVSGGIIREHWVQVICLQCVLSQANFDKQCSTWRGRDNETGGAAPETEGGGSLTLWMSGTPIDSWSKGLDLKLLYTIYINHSHITHLGFKE